MLLLIFFLFSIFNSPFPCCLYTVLQKFFFYFFIDFLNPVVIDLGIQEYFHCVFCLGDQHLQTGDADHAKLSCLGDQFCGERVVDHIHHCLAVWELSQIYWTGIYLWVHADGAGVYDHLGIGVAGE